MLARNGEPIFEGVNPWENANQSIQNEESGANETFFFANLESPVNESGQSTKIIDGYDLCAGSSQTSLLTEAGINVVNLANNHQDDCGLSSTTSESISTAGITGVGLDLSPVYLETDSGRIGIIGAEDVTQSIDDGALLKSAAQARKYCDLLIVALHWGNEYQQGATERQEQLAQEMANAGVDILWGTHPHVLQKMQWIQSAGEDHKMLVMFSLGNLLADQWMSSQTQQTALVTVTIQNKKITGVTLLPLQMERSTRQLRLADEEGTASIESALGLTGLTLPIPAEE